MKSLMRILKCVLFLKKSGRCMMNGEIIRAICDYKKIDMGKLEVLRKKKAKERGGFKKKIIIDEN